MNLEVLQEHDLLYAKLKVEKPSIYLKELKNTLASFATVHVSLSTICKSFKHINMNDGSWIMDEKSVSESIRRTIYAT